MYLLLTICSVGLIIYLLLLHRFSYWKRLNVPFCKPTFLFGNVGAAITLRTPLSSIIKKLYSDYSEYRYVGFFDMWTPAIMVRDPEIIKKVLVKDFYSYRNFFVTEHHVDPIAYLNPFILYGSKWKSVRSILTPQFTIAKVKPMVSNIQAINKKMISYIKKEIQTNKHLEVRELAERYAGDTVLLSAFGLDGMSFQEGSSDSSKIVDQIFTKCSFVQLKQTASIFFPILRKIFRVTFLGDPVPQMFKNIIIDTFKYRNKNNIVRNDYLGYLTEMKEKSLPYYTTDDHLVSHSFTFFLDGFGTSGLSFAYALFELSQNQDIQEEARNEIYRVLQNHNNELSYEALQEMEYIECILLETVRKHPIIKIFGRVCVEDVAFPSPYANDDSQEVIIKKGTEVFFSSEGLHHDSKYYPNPQVFDPKRFNEKNKNLRPKHSFLGFGDGPKICLGQNFAFAQIKLGLIAILSEFNLEINENTIVPFEEQNVHLFKSPKSEMWVNFTPRF